MGRKSRLKRERSPVAIRPAPPSVEENDRTLNEMLVKNLKDRMNSVTLPRHQEAVPAEPEDQPESYPMWMTPFARQLMLSALRIALRKQNDRRI